MTIGISSDYGVPLKSPLLQFYSILAQLSELALKFNSFNHRCRKLVSTGNWTLFWITILREGSKGRGFPSLWKSFESLRVLRCNFVQHFGQIFRKISDFWNFLQREQTSGFFESREEAYFSPTTFMSGGGGFSPPAPCFLRLCL